MGETKAFQVFQSELNIRIYNKPIIGNHRYDTKIFWEHLNGNRKDVIKSCHKYGFYNLDDCLDNCIKYINKYKLENPIKTQNVKQND
ncbi:MAG: hypothetical protein PF487_01325 [Bacteroidales bacterium]|nr:hypothetical protein [Bacteroidales bacterium]